MNWKLDKDWVMPEGGIDVEERICVVSGPLSRREVNGPLIAAAPELLAALNVLVSDFEDVLPTLRATGWQTANEEAVLNRARAAINKAKGIQ